METTTLQLRLTWIYHLHLSLLHLSLLQMILALYVKTLH
jgi:hypothetical protein